MTKNDKNCNFFGKKLLGDNPRSRYKALFGLRRTSWAKSGTDNSKYSVEIFCHRFGLRIPRERSRKNHNKNKKTDVNMPKRVLKKPSNNQQSMRAFMPDKRYGWSIQL